MKKTLIILLTLYSSLLAYNSSADAQIARMKAEFETSKQRQLQEFGDYKTALNKEYANYKKELLEYWKKPELSSKKKWISYSKDKKSRSKVNFEKNNYTVEVIAKDAREAKKRLQERISYIASKNTKEVIQSDPLQKKVAQLSKNPEVAHSKVKATPILAPLLFKKKPTKKDADNYAKNVVDTHTIIKKESKKKDENVYKVTVKLPKNSKIRLSQTYQADVAKNYRRFKLQKELLFAIMQTESDFNPFAKSHIPAFGLMQIVPRSAGRDSYKFLFNKDKKPSATYLYDSKNNIEMGSAYLHILYYRYLKKIKDPQSRLYCTIAAYNTGAGNIAWAFTKTHNMNKAAPKINALTPNEVYNRLLSDLKYDEPKHYLKRVTKRMKVYKVAYKEL